MQRGHACNARRTPTRATMKTPASLVAMLMLAAAGVCAQGVPAARPAPLQGEVLEVLDVDGYTYLRLKTRDGEAWAAVTTAPVKKGAQVSITEPAVMQNFESKTLKRRFDRIVFGQLAAPGAPPTGPHAAMPAMPAAPPAAPIRVAKATGADAKTVAEVVKGKAGLKDKAVLVRGQVVKVNLAIMGKNWLHLRDGSGSASDGSNDVIVTTKDSAAVGDVVSARGTVRTDVTVGPGYAYEVLIEDAALRK